MLFPHFLKLITSRTLAWLFYIFPFILQCYILWWPNIGRKEQLCSSSYHEHGHSCATTMKHFVNSAQTVITKFNQIWDSCCLRTFILYMSHFKYFVLPLSIMLPVKIELTWQPRGQICSYNMNNTQNQITKYLWTLTFLRITWRHNGNELKYCPLYWPSAFFLHLINIS